MVCMKKTFVGLLVLFFFMFVVWYLVRSKPGNLAMPIAYHNSVTPSGSPIHQILISQKQTVLFVPYWTLGNGQIEGNYDTLVYFGAGVTTSGVDTTDAGYMNIDSFLAKSPARKNLLAIRMIDSTVDLNVLDDAGLQKKIIDQSVALAKQKGFSGVVLDFEISALAFDSVVKGISSFETEFALVSHRNNLSFYPMIYGDTFYQVRPFDVSTIAKASDGVMIMAYDFHKAGGNPGPNFPLQASDYDLKHMISAFLQKVPVSQITVIFGMYGYDWQVDDKGQRIGVAHSYSDFEMKQKFLDSCTFAKCVVRRDPASGEMKVTYIGGDGKHEVWFEDTTSALEKSLFLRSVGVGSIGYWAYSYF